MTSTPKEEEASGPSAPPEYTPAMQQPMQPMPQMQAPMPQVIHQPMNTTNVVVVNQQPAAETKLVLGSIHGHREWTTGLFSCTEDFTSCLKSIVCSGCVLMEISAKLNENICVINLVPGALATLRTRLRTLGGIRGSILKDYIAVNCCPWCVICQMDREMQNMQL